MSGRWRHPNRTATIDRTRNLRPRRYKPDTKILRRVEENLDEYRWAARHICELVAKIQI
jgi:hypothetical protein